MGKENKQVGMFILISLAVVVQVVICQDCFFKSSLYIGHVNKTVDNVTCDRWDAHLSHIDPLTLNLPDASTFETANYCRDPDEKGHPWCYVSNDPHHKTWEFCDVLFCRECYFANRSNEYNGYVTTSMNGNCLAWTGISFPDSSFPDGSVARARNYCRDPDNRGYPHCLTNHGFLPCLIPKCNHSVCADDPNTLCEILKSVICGVKDMAQKLCPKTCGMCGFSLMSPVHIKPPVHNAIHPVCEDNPMARCDTLKQFICGTAQATQLCPKTCNLCSAPTTAPLTISPRVPSPTLAPVKFTTDGTAPTTATLIKPLKGECFFRSVVYLGGVSKTVDNITCDRWDAHILPNDPLVSMFPDQSVKDAASYCRDPDNKGHPWCYIKGHPSKSWEFCDVPYCNECYYANQSHMYNGYVSTTNNGECLNWTGVFPDSFFIDGNIIKSKNYCRDPDNTGYPYCRTTHGLTSCIIPQCKGTCENNPATRCEHFKQIICQSEHLARLFCPKSCNMCGFGLLEPVHRPPPVHQANNIYDVTSTLSTTRSRSTLHPTTKISSVLPTIKQDICVDTANFSCNNPEIRGLICIDPPAASNYCRKTCGYCDSDVVPLNLDSCGDPIKESMCKLLNNEVCLCNDKLLASVLCPHYCANQCGPVNRLIYCPDPPEMALVGRR